MSARTMLVVVSLLAAVLFTGVAISQPLPVRLYGGSLGEQCHALVEGVDPGFCLAGWTRSYGPAGNENVLVVKTDPLGAPIWARVSSGAADEEARAMVKTGDGYVLAGWTRSYGPGAPAKNIFVIKLDPAGNSVWGRVYGGFQDDEAFSIVQTQDGGFALTGLTYSFGPNPTPNILVLKLDPLGLFQWMRVYWMTSGHGENEGCSIVQTADLGYAVCGRAKVTGPALYNPFLMKLDPAGNVQWVQISGANYSDEAYSVALSRCQDILVAGRTLSFGTAPGLAKDMFVAEFSNSGTPAWSRTFGWPNGDEEALDDRSLVGTKDSGCVVCGPTTSVGPGIPNPNFLILKLDANGLPQWCRSHPSPFDPGLLSDVPLPMIEMQFGGYAVAGWTNSYQSKLGGMDFMLSTFDPMGNRPVCAEPQDPLVMDMPWMEWRTSDSIYYPEHDTMLLMPTSVGYDSVCYKAESTGVKEQRSGARSQGLGLRVSGRSIELTLDHATCVEVQVFACDGRQVVRIGRTEYSAGQHEIALPGNISSGAYIVSATGGGRSASTKMVKF